MDFVAHEELEILCVTSRGCEASKELFCPKGLFIKSFLLAAFFYVVVLALAEFDFLSVFIPSGAPDIVRFWTCIVRYLLPLAFVWHTVLDFWLFVVGCCSGFWLGCLVL